MYHVFFSSSDWHALLEHEDDSPGHDKDEPKGLGQQRKRPSRGRKEERKLVASEEEEEKQRRSEEGVTERAERRRQKRKRERQ